MAACFFAQYSPVAICACSLPNPGECFAENLFVLRDFRSRGRLRILLDSIADMDLYRIGFLEHSPFKTDLCRKDAKKKCRAVSGAVAGRSRALLQLNMQ